MIISHDDFTNRSPHYDTFENDVCGDLKMYKNVNEKFTTENLNKYHNRWTFRLVVDQVVDLRFVLIVFGTLDTFSNNCIGRFYRDANGHPKPQYHFDDRVMLTFDKTKKDFIKVNDGTVLHHIDYIDFNPALDVRTKNKYTLQLKTVSYAIYYYNL